VSDAAEELIKNVFNLGDYSFADIEFSDLEHIKEDEQSYWNVLLHLRSSDTKINVGQCWFGQDDKEVAFYVDMDELMQMVIEEVNTKVKKFVMKEFGQIINPELNVQIYGKDYT
tara:strand:- start:1165 stop:1506 length:342 start_codon:yes stop_codon:yes gene_type:complete